MPIASANRERAVKVAINISRLSAIHLNRKKKRKERKNYFRLSWLGISIPSFPLFNFYFSNFFFLLENRSNRQSESNQIECNKTWNREKWHWPQIGYPLSLNLRSPLPTCWIQTSNRMYSNEPGHNSQVPVLPCSAAVCIVYLGINLYDLCHDQCSIPLKSPSSDWKWFGILLVLIIQFIAAGFRYGRR